MSENNDNKWIWAFVLGFVLGVIVCLGGGGYFASKIQQQATEEVAKAREEIKKVQEKWRRIEYQRDFAEIMRNKE